MAIVFERTPRSIAVRSAISALIAATVGSAFASLVFLVDDLPNVVKIVAAIAVVVCLWMTLKICKEAISALRSGQGWRVEVTDQHLSWQSPDPNFMRSFELPLSNIKSVRRELHIKKNSKASPTHKFYIERTDGDTLEIKYRLSAINPMKVFTALEGLGVPYSQETVRSGGKFAVGIS